MHEESHMDRIPQEIPPSRPESTLSLRLKFDERLLGALEKIADALSNFSMDYHRRLELEYPAKREPHDATVTRIPTDEDLIRAEHSGTGESIDDWVRLGPRESRFIADEKDEGPKKD